MRTLLIVLGLAAIAWSLGGSRALACGDKLLGLNRGVRYQRAYAAAHPTSILAYARPASAMPAAMKELQLELNLKLAGHKVRVIDSPDQLSEALKSGRYDLVLADFADLDALAQQTQSLTVKPLVLPVLYGRSKQEVAAAAQQHRWVVKTPGKTSQFLATIDEAMKWRVTSQSRS